MAPLGEQCYDTQWLGVGRVWGRLTAFLPKLDAGVLEVVGVAEGCTGLLSHSSARSVGRAGESAGSSIIAVGNK